MIASYLAMFFWFGFSFFLMAIQQLKLKTRKALLIVFATSVVIVVTDVILHFFAVTNGMAIWIFPIILFFPASVVGLVIAFFVEKYGQAESDVGGQIFDNAKDN
jgi:hypothetical protein